MVDYKEILGRMGNGWFILKLAEDNGIDIGKTKTYYGKPSSMKTRINTYDESKADHIAILDYLIHNWNNSYIAGEPVVSNFDLYKLARQLQCIFCKKSKTNKSSISRNVRINDATLEDDNFPFYGPDEDGYWIRYNDDVEMNERVPGLCRFLESHYERIVAHARNLFNGNEAQMIPVILSKEKPTDKIENDIVKWLKTLVNLYGRDLTEKQIQSVINNEIMIMPILGHFIYDDKDRFDGRPYIKIYYQNTDINNIDEYFAEMVMVLAHEYFHYYHYEYVTKIKFKGTNYEDKHVKESLADFFAYHYLINSNYSNGKFITIADKRYLFWENYFGSSVPYADALRYFISKNNIDYPKVYKVFEKSRVSMKNAYKELAK